MSISKEDVLAALGKIASPEGVPLPATGKLSDIVVADGKVFFSITVDSGAVEAWEAVRERAQKLRQRPDRVRVRRLVRQRHRRPVFRE